MNAPDRFDLQQTRFIRAPRDKVFDAFTEEALLRQWHCPRGMRVVHCRCEPRPGGSWELGMQARDGTRLALVGAYREVTRPDRLVYTWTWQGENSPMAGLQTLVEVDFAKHAESMGAHAETVHSIGDLEQAFARAKKVDRTAVIVIKVQSHQWTPGDSWWEVGVPEVSTRKEVRAARADFEKGKARQRIGV